MAPVAETIITTGFICSGFERQPLSLPDGARVILVCAPCCAALIGVIWRRSGVPAHRKYLPGTDYVQLVGGVHLFPLGHSLIVRVGRRYHRIADITEIFTKEEARHNS